MSTDTHSDTTSRRPRPARYMVAAVSTLLIADIVIRYAGEALFTTLVTDHPVALVLLQPVMRSFALVTNQMDALSYYGIGIPRVIVTDPLWWLLGVWYGDAAIAWMERRTRTWGDTLRRVEQAFGRWGYLILFALPYGFTPLLAGAGRMPLHRVVAVRAAGLAVRLYIIRLLGQAFDDPIDWLLGLIADYRIPLLIASVILVIISIVLEARRGGTKVESLAHLEEEIEEEEKT